MWWARVNLRLVQRISDFIREDAGGKTRYKLRGMRKVGSMQNVIVDKDVIAEERQLMIAMRMSTLIIKRNTLPHTLYFMFLNNPPTVKQQISGYDYQPYRSIDQSNAPSAAKWMTCVGLYFSYNLRVCSGSLHRM